MKSCSVGACILLVLGLVAGFLLITAHPEAMPPLLRDSVPEDKNPYKKRMQIAEEEIRREKAKASPDQERLRFWQEEWKRAKAGLEK